MRSFKLNASADIKARSLEEAQAKFVQMLIDGHYRRGQDATSKTAIAAVKGGAMIAKPPRSTKADPLLDTRTTVELWLDGESDVPSDRAYNRARKTEYRRVRVTFADGSERVTGSYLSDDAQALAWCTRVARAMEMTARLTGGKTCNPRFSDGPEWVEVKVPVFGPAPTPDPNGWSKRRPGGFTIRVRICDLPDVVDAAFTDDFAPREHVISRTTAVQVRIDKLAAMTTERGASAAEADFARQKLEEMQSQAA